jgi:hypothetical protein
MTARDRLGSSLAQQCVKKRGIVLTAKFTCIEAVDPRLAT